MQERQLAKCLMCLTVLTTGLASLAAEPSPGKVRVFLLTGQSNMEGKGLAAHLDTYRDDPLIADTYADLKDNDLKVNDGWRTRDDVWITYPTKPNGAMSGGLTAGYGTKGENSIGPEFGFGHTIGNALDEPVVLIKIAWGGKSLAVDFRPPSAGLPAQAELDTQLARLQKKNASATLDDVKSTYGFYYRELIRETTLALADLGTTFPQLADRQYELAGIVWHQGFNDVINRDLKATQYRDYTRWLQLFIQDIRRDLRAPRAPFVIGELSTGGIPNRGDFQKAQAAAAELPELRGNVAFVPTAEYYDTRAHDLYEKNYWKGTDEQKAEWQRVGNDRPYHYLGSGKTYYLKGQAFANAMLKMLTPQGPKVEGPKVEGPKVEGPNDEGSKDDISAIPDLHKDKSVSDRVLPTGQILQPAGELLQFAGRPNDLVYASDSDLLFVKSHKQLLVVKASDWTLQQQLDIPGGASLTGILVDATGRVFISNAADRIHVFTPQASGEYSLHHSIKLPSKSFPCGMCFSPDESKLFVCLSISNALAVVDMATQTLTDSVPVGISPFAAEYVSGNRLVVSNLGGRRATVEDVTALSAGTETPVDQRGIANTSSVSIIDVASLKTIHSVTAGLHPTDIASFTNASMVLVTNSNDDSVTCIETATGGLRTVLAKPMADLPFGSMPSSAAVTPDGDFLFVALAGNNAVAVYDLTETPNLLEADLVPIGFIPTAWYPVALAVSNDELFIANLKGTGSRANVRDVSEGRNSHDHQGAIQKIDLTAMRDRSLLDEWSTFVKATAALLPTQRLQSTSDAKQEARAIPRTLGEPSVFKHVIYVIKENRTYDQVFGDMPEGRGEPTLCTFPEKYTPNHHKLARRFGLLDNYYCNGVLSADGHSWATEANVTPYLERAFGGFTRSYTFGDDPLTYSSSGFLWDHVLAAGLTFRNYGEMGYAQPANDVRYQRIWADYQAGKPLEFTQEIGIDRLRRYSCPDYPGWNIYIPDVLRMDRFLTEFEAFKSEGSLPNFCIVYLPQDHLGGGVTSAAHMADNDLALGRLVDAVSHSEYWKDTLIIANEDDPQNGYDHIDGHRSLCLVISAYSKAGVNHSFYNQTSVIRTMLHCLGIPPMNQQDARSPLMTDCFLNTANLSPYAAEEANFPLNQTASDTSKQSAVERHWRSMLATVPIERTGMKTEKDEDNLNRFVWHEMQGWDTAYPHQWVGSHGRGLKSLKLQLNPAEDTD